MENAVENDHEESSPIPSANPPVGHSRQPKRPQRARNVTSVAKPRYFDTSQYLSVTLSPVI